MSVISRWASANQPPHAAAVQATRIARGGERPRPWIFEAHFFLPIFCLILVVLGWATTLHVMHLEAISAQRTAVQSCRELADTYQAQMQRNLVYIDQTLKIIKFNVEKSPGSKLADFETRGLLPPAQIFSIAVADAQGRVVDINGDQTGLGISVAQRPFFPAQRERVRFHQVNSSPLISEIAHDPTTGFAQVTFSRGLVDKHGHFLGVVMLSVDPAYFTSGYDTARMGDHGLLMLVGNDMKVRAERIGNQTQWGETLSDAKLLAALRTPAEDADITTWADGVARYSSVRTLHGFPLLAVVGLSRHEQMRMFRESRRTYIAWTGVATVLLLLLTAVVSRMNWQLERSRLKARQLERLADERRVEQSRLLEMIATSTPLDQILAYLTQLLDEQIEGAVTSILVFDAKGKRLMPAAPSRLPLGYLAAAEGAPIGPQAGPAGQTIHYRAPVHLSRLTSSKFDSAMQACGMTGLSDCWSFPVLRHDGTDKAPLAALSLFVRDARGPTALEQSTISMAIRVIAIAVERSRVEQKIRHMAKHDALTGLPNRTMLYERLQHALLDAAEKNRTVTVVFVDLDNFKLINDGLGHGAGDTLLKTVSQRMVEALEPTDTVARLGGDEFVMVLSALRHENDGLAESIDRLRAVITEPVRLFDGDYRVSASLGTASFPGDGADAETLLMNADAAMYRAKDSGRDAWRRYTADMHAQTHEKLRIQEALRHALTNNEFHIVYQPQIDLAQGRVFGAEALLRWTLPREGAIAPDLFIPLAEESGQIVSIGAWILSEACRQNKAWQDAGYPPVIVSVNVSARQFTDERLVEHVQSALRESGLSPAYLELEITESVIMLDVARAIETMRTLESMGVKLSVDDFGTGYSSLSALKQFPIARLKIDQSFIRRIDEDKGDQAIAAAIIALGRQLDLDVIAEGVETQAQLAFLRENGCHHVQGYCYSCPVAPEAFSDLLRAAFVSPAKDIR